MFLMKRHQTVLLVAILSVTIACLVCLVVLSWKPNQLALADLMQTLSTQQVEYKSNREQTIENESEKSTEPTAKLLNSTKPKERTVETTQKQNVIKFLYMLQTESCLSEYLQEVIGDPSVCPCDVSVLSYRSKCAKTPPPNVKYIFTGTRTSWGGGRNVLYEDTMKREQIYLYFIVMDDDIVLQPKSEKDSKGSPWRMFEEFLERVEPAAAAIDIENKLWLHRAADGRKHMHCSVNESSEYLSVARYDAAFNAFHNKTVRHILPYTSKFDHTSWTFAPIYVNIKIELMYAGHSVLHNQIFATNPKHRPYPKHYPTPEELKAIVDETANDLPEKYRNSSLLKGWRKNGLGHEQWSPTVCIPPPPPKMPITQFAYIDGKLHV